MTPDPELFRAAFEEHPDACWLLDPLGNPIAANRAAASGAHCAGQPGLFERELAGGFRLIVAPGATDADFEQRRLALIEMAAGDGPLEDTLDAIAAMIGGLSAGRRSAVLLLRDDRFKVAAARGLSAPEREALANVSPEVLSGPGPALAPGGFTLRPLVSAAGEVLGAIGFCPAAECQPDPMQEERLSALGSIAVLAVEHCNLLEELTYRAQHDSLTRVWNRLSFEDRLTRALSSARHSNSRLGVLYLDLDHFRLINDVAGHQVGDVLLRQIAERFQRHTRPSDVIARAGGDEFLFLIPSLETPDEARAVGERLLAGLEPPFTIGDHELFVSASIGISVSNTADTRVKDLESRAYTALEHAKRSGRNQVAVFDASMTGHSSERLALEHRLRQALPNGELLMNYQPQVELGTGALTGVEALIRWRHPELGLVSPGTFIPIAEESGLICSFGEFALYETLRQSLFWREHGLTSLRVCVNVSPLQFCRPDFARRTIATIREFEIDPSQLELEITEGVVMQNVEAALGHMNQLREIGVQFAIDDFGTGHSSLAYLQKLPIQRIKIDQAFVKEITLATDRPPLVANIIRLAHALDVPAIVEGIETLEQAVALTAMGCEEAQGYFFSKPLAPRELPGWARHSGRVRPEPEASMVS